jgi:hypothetical protein
MSIRVRILLEIIVSIIVGFLSDFVIRDPFISFAVGVFSFLVVETVRTGIQIDHINQSVNILAEVTGTFRTAFRNNLDSYFYMLLLSRINKTFRDSDISRIAIPASDGHGFWLRIFSYTETSYLATTHSSYYEGWNRGFSDQNMIIHKSKIDSDVNIKRVFIVHDAKDYETMKEIMILQKEIGINVRYIYVSKIKSIDFLLTKVRRFGTYDFAIIDDTHTLKVFLNRNRRWTGLELSNDVDTLRLAKVIYEEIWHESTPV